MSIEPGGSGAGSTVAWVTLDDLPHGTLFETRNGYLAVKSEYRYPSGQWECTLLASGEYAHFATGNTTEVRGVDVAQLRADLEAAQDQIRAIEALRQGQLGVQLTEQMRLKAELEAAQAEIERLKKDNRELRMVADSDEFDVFERLRKHDRATIERQNAVIEAAKTLRNHDCGVCATSWCDQRDIRLSNAFDKALAALDAAADGEA